MGEESLLSPDLTQWRTRQEAERERLRQLDHTPAPPERPPKKPHLRPTGLSSWRSNTELGQRRTETGNPPKAQKAKTHSGLPDLGQLGTGAPWRAVKGVRGVIEGEVKQTAPGAQNDAPLVLTGTAAGNVAAKRNFFAPQPFGKSGGGDDQSRAVPRLRPSRTFPQLQLNIEKSSR